MELKLINDEGQEASRLEASDVLFGREYNEALVHQVLVAYQANARSGNRAQKDRQDVRHTTKKPWRQKGTGRARAGMSSSPIWRGGGRVFPNSSDENFSHKLNRKNATYAPNAWLLTYGIRGSMSYAIATAKTVSTFQKM